MEDVGKDSLGFERECVILACFRVDYYRDIGQMLETCKSKLNMKIC